MRAQIHEDLSRETRIETSSDRSFGVVLAAAFLVLAAWPMRTGDAPRYPALGIGAAFVLCALIKPSVLHPLNRAWLWVGLLLAKLIHPIVLALLFFGVVTPVGILVRLCGKDLLRLRFDRSARTYWIHRDPPGPAPATMSKQF
jgi:hypothetical protein